MIESLREVIADNPSLRCVVISSNGSVFSSGHDLKELADRVKTYQFFEIVSRREDGSIRANDNTSK
ncbi:unnamed protein product [Oppiella nova]|uniref:Enoyl-CoA hydratase n=1 Tax=Oppiella nova TaxID=334625 RepID=A0A7R9MAP4_9ACAR|nr:unnamed protein product [Oppiella nova]CAG2173823.1 unnamed protein product [Oppiella nova]